MISLRLLASLFLLAAALGANDQKTASKKSPVKAEPAAPAADLIWPLPPDPPRVRWLVEFADMAKVKKPAPKKSAWMEKITGTKTPDEVMELRKPYGIATDRRGRIYTADTELKVVFVIDAAAKSVERREGSSRSPMALPVGVAVDAEDRLFVSDADLHSITCFSPTGQPIAHFGAALLGRPGGIAIDRQRNRLYVADAKMGRVAVFDSSTLEFRDYYGKPSSGGRHDNGTFFGPTNVAVDRRGFIYVSDTLNYRVQVLDASGKFVRAFGVQGDRPGEFIRPKGIAVDSQGHIYVADAEFNNFQIFTSEGQPLLAIGALGTDRGQFALLAGLYIDEEDRIYTTEMFRGRIQVFQYIPQPDASQEKGVGRNNGH